MSSSHRVMVRTCNGLELRDPGIYSDSGGVGDSGGDLIDDPSGLFPSASSRDELTPRSVPVLIKIPYSCSVY